LSCGRSVTPDDRGNTPKCPYYVPKGAGDSCICAYKHSELKLLRTISIPKPENMELLKNYDIDLYTNELKTISKGQKSLQSRTANIGRLKAKETCKGEKIAAVWVRVRWSKAANTFISDAPDMIRRVKTLPVTIRRRAGITAKMRGNEKRINSQKMGNGILLQNRGVLLSKNERRKAAQAKRK